MKKLISFLITIFILGQVTPLSFAKIITEPSTDALLYVEGQSILKCFEPRKMIRSKTAKTDINWAVSLTVAEASCALLNHVHIDRREAFEKSQDVDDVDISNIDSYLVPFVKEAFRRGFFEDMKADNLLKRYQALKMLLDVEGIPILKVLRDEDRTHEFRDVRRDSEIEYIMMTSINRDLARPISTHISGAKKNMTRGEYVNILYNSSLVSHADFFFEKPGQLDGFDSEMMPLIEIFSQPVGNIPKYDIFLTIWDILSNAHLYSDRFDGEEAMNKVLEALPEVLDDPYTGYMDYEENDSFQDSIRGDFEGIGAYISKEGEDLTIVSPIKKMPAEKAGLKSGDIVIKIEGEETKDLSLQEAVRKIKGPRDSKVNLTIKRNGRIFSVDIIRARVEIPAVEYEIRDNRVMYINIFQFSQKAEEEFKKAVNATLSSGVAGVVVDLRNNPGGLLSSVENIAGYFVPRGKTVVQVEYSNVLQEVLSIGKAELSFYPVAVLINNGSASASEILAGAIQDHGLGQIFGETSFGKGTVQEVMPFFDGSSFRYTVAEWLTPKGHSINENGIEPDFEVEDYQDTYLDEMYEKALEKMLFPNRIPGRYYY